jgi:hypothetical protein
MQKAALHIAVSDQRASLAEVLSAAMPGAPEERIGRLIDTLILVTRPSPLTPANPQAFRHTGKARSDRTLRDLLRQLRQAEVRLKHAEAMVGELSATDIARLAECGVMRSNLTTSLRNIIAAVTRALSVPPPTEPSRGRPKQELAFAVAYELLRACVEVTGYDPQQPLSRQSWSGFAPLLGEVFSILGISESARAASARAERDWNERHKNPSI